MADGIATPRTDAELVRLAQGGELAAFEALVGRFEQKAFSHAWRILRHREDAEDITQQAFLSALEHLGEFRGDAAFGTWLLRIVTHAALKVLRKRKTVPFVSLEASSESTDDYASVPHPAFIADWRESPEQLVVRKEVQHLLDEALSELDEKFRLVFLLRDVQGLSIQETADALGLTEANVKVRLLRARLQLRERLTLVLGDKERQLPPHRHDPG